MNSRLKNATFTFYLVLIWIIFNNVSVERKLSNTGQLSVWTEIVLLSDGNLLSERTIKMFNFITYVEDVCVYVYFETTYRFQWVVIYFIIYNPPSKELQIFSYINVTSQRVVMKIMQFTFISKIPVGNCKLGTSYWQDKQVTQIKGKLVIKNQNFWCEYQQEIKIIITTIRLYPDAFRLYYGLISEQSCCQI